MGIIFLEVTILLKLIYFKMRALAEAPQMLMHCNNIEYEYLMSWEHFADHWSKVKPNLAFKQLPMLEVEGGHQIFQSIAILKFLESRAGLSISDPIQEAKANAILQSAQELFAPLNPTVNFAVDDDFLSKRDAMRPMLANRFQELSNCLAENGSKFFMDDKPRAAEFATFHHLDLSKKLDDSLIKQFPRLERLVDDMMCLQGMSEYLLRRPTLIGVGKGPKLVIGGIEHSTGVEQT
ncbi:glutathione S-transferase family protein [Oceanospirillaceae bacterium]|nr:glutathione S-transferase family protein [Oceanospirillaceae bacterium]